MGQDVPMADDLVPQAEAPRRTLLPDDPVYIQQLLMQNSVWKTRDRTTGNLVEVSIWDMHISHLTNVIGWLDGQVGHILTVLGQDQDALSAPAMIAWLHRTPLCKALDAALLAKRREAERAAPPATFKPSEWLVRPMVSLDIETTGVDIENDRIVSFSIGTSQVPLEGDWEAISQIVDPGVEIPEGARKVHGISTERARAEGIPERDAVLGLVRSLSRLHDTPIIAFNCFEGNTRFQVRDRGARTLQELAGTIQEVWNGEQWVKAAVRSYGTAPVRRLVLAPAGRSRSAIRHEVWVTDNHRWVLDDGSEVTTDQLRTWTPHRRAGAMKIRASYLRPEVDEEGLRHGLIFADGSLVSRSQQPKEGYVHRLRLCGAKARFVSLFPKFTYPPSANGDPVITWYKSARNCKEVPEDPESDAYVAGFIEGWVTLDGSEATQHGVARRLDTVHEDAARWLIDNAWRGGWLVTGYSVRPLTSEWGKSELLHTVVLSRDQSMAWRLAEIGDEIREVEVFCAEVEEGPEQFTLAGGILTRNSRFDLTVLDRSARRYIGQGIAPTYVLDPFVLDKLIDPYRKGKRTLDAVCEHYQVGRRIVHEADEDAQRALRLLYKELLSPVAYEFFGGRFPGLPALQEIQADAYADQVRGLSHWQASGGQVPDVRDDRWPIASLPRTEMVSYDREPPY